MATKKENKRDSVRKARRLIKNPIVDVGGKLSGKKISRKGYGAGVNKSDFPHKVVP